MCKRVVSIQGGGLWCVVEGTGGRTSSIQDIGYSTVAIVISKSSFLIS